MISVLVKISQNSSRCDDNISQNHQHSVGSDIYICENHQKDKRFAVCIGTRKSLHSSAITDVYSIRLSIEYNRKAKIRRQPNDDIRCHVFHPFSSGFADIFSVEHRSGNNHCKEFVRRQATKAAANTGSTI